jgi:hypothetical protein
MSNKISIGTVEMIQPINGIDVKIPIDLNMSITGTDNKFLIVIDALAHLHDFQKKAEAIIKTFPLPNDLSGYGTKFKVTIENAKLLSQGGNLAYLEVNLDTEVWKIEKGIPLGGTTIRYETKCVDMGFLGRICSKVPISIEPRAGSDLKTKLISEGFNAKATFSLSTPDGNSIKINYHDINVQPRGDIGRFINDVARIFDNDINSHLRDIMDKQITRNLKIALPDNIEKFNPEIKTIQFTKIIDGSLGIFTTFQAEISGVQLNELLAENLDG